MTLRVGRPRNTMYVMGKFTARYFAIMVHEFLVLDPESSLLVPKEYVTSPTKGSLTAFRSFSLYCNFLWNWRVMMSMKLHISTSIQRTMTVPILSCIARMSLWGVYKVHISFGLNIMVGLTSGFNSLVPIMWLSYQIRNFLYPTFSFL